MVAALNQIMVLQKILGGKVMQNTMNLGSEDNAFSAILGQMRSGQKANNNHVISNVDTSLAQELTTTIIDGKESMIIPRKLLHTHPNVDNEETLVSLQDTNPNMDDMPFDAESLTLNTQKMFNTTDMTFLADINFTPEEFNTALPMVIEQVDKSQEPLTLEPMLLQKQVKISSLTDNRQQIVANSYIEQGENIAINVDEVAQYSDDMIGKIDTVLSNDQDYNDNELASPSDLSQANKTIVNKTISSGNNVSINYDNKGLHLGKEILSETAPEKITVKATVDHIDNQISVMLERSNDEEIIQQRDNIVIPNTIHIADDNSYEKDMKTVVAVADKNIALTGDNIEINQNTEYKAAKALTLKKDSNIQNTTNEVQHLNSGNIVSGNKAEHREPLVQSENISDHAAHKYYITTEEKTKDTVAEKLTVMANSELENKTTNSRHIYTNTQSKTPIAESAASQVAMKIVGEVKSNISKIDVQLFPKDLGKVQISMELTENNNTKILIVVDKLSTLDALQKSSAVIENILNENGIKQENTNLNFQFKGHEKEQQGQKNQQQQHSNDNEQQFDDELMNLDLDLELGFVGHRKINIVT